MRDRKWMSLGRLQMGNDIKYLGTASLYMVPNDIIKAS